MTAVQADVLVLGGGLAADRPTPSGPDRRMPKPLFGGPDVRQAEPLPRYPKGSFPLALMLTA